MVKRPPTDPDPERWDTIESICFEAMGLTGPEREAFLDRRCARDADLRRRVDELLVAFDRSPAFLDRPAVSLPADLVGPGGRDLPEADELIGRYRLIRPIGHGGMGDVFLAMEHGDGFTRTVALKLIRKGLDTERVLERFRLERRILAGLRHPNIAQLLDAGATEGGRPWFAMEFVDGEPVDAYCDRRGLSVDERLRLAETICGAVQHAHQNLVVHRDIKPANILVTADGVPKLLDFGIGKVLSDDAAMDGQVTRVEDRALTPDFAAPEILRGDPVTTATDLYGLGVLIYVLLTGTLPYPGGGHHGEQLKARGDPPRRPSETAPAGRRLTGELDAIVLKALAPETDRRYGSATELADDLRRYREGRPVRARAPGPLYVARKFVGRHRVAMGAASIVALSLLGGAVYTVEQSRRVADERDKALEVRGFLLETFGAAGADRSVGDSLTARALLDGQAAIVREAYDDQPELEAEMMVVLAEGYERLGLFTEAMVWAEDALALRAEAPPGDRAAATDLVGWITHQLGRPDDALPILERAVAEAREDRNAERVLARSLNDLGVVQEALGDFDGAEASHREAMALRIDLFGEDHRSVAVSASNLSVIRYRKGDFDGAVADARRALEVVRSAFGADHQRAIIVQSNLSVFRLVGGDLQGAEAEMRDLWARQARLQGPDHPVTVRVMNNLASVLRQQEKWMEAETVLRQVLRIMEESDEPNATDMATTLANLGDAVAYREAFDEAESLVRRALEIQNDVLGPDHVDTANSQVFMSNVFERAGDLDQAIRWRSDAASTFSRVLGAAREPTLTQRLDVARLLTMAGRDDEARSVLEAIVDTGSPELGLEHALVVEARRRLREER